MSYQIRIKVFWSGEERDQILSSVKDYLDRDGSIGLLEDISVAFFSESDEIEWLEVQWVKGLFLYLSGCFPEEEFVVRGVGGEIDDVWVLWFCAGRVLRVASLDGKREGPLQSETPTAEWPEPLEIERVVHQAGLKTFLRDFLIEQPPTATVGALTVRSRSDGRPRALIYVGPLGHDVSWRFSFLFQPKHEVQLFWSAEKLLNDSTATAKDPCGY